MDLNLKNPIAFFDLETTGINTASDRVVEISILKISPGGNEDLLTMRINPEMHIPKQSSEIHGIYDADIQDAPTFKQEAKNFAHFLEGCDLARYNCNRFDIPVLAEEFLRAGLDVNLKKRKVIDVQVIFHKMEQRTLAAALKFYCHKNLEDAHTAEADTRATYEVLKGQLDHYDTLENEVGFLAEFSTNNRTVDFAGRIVLNDKDEEVFNFGKHKGKPATEVLKAEPSYFGWMMNGDFSQNTKKVLKQIKDSIK